MALTVKGIAKVGKDPGRYGDGRGLYLQVTPAGVRSWLLRYQRGGKERAMGLGAFDDFTLEEARERARAARQLLKDGIDPIDARDAERAQAAALEAKAKAATVTFKDCAEQFFKFHSVKWSNAKHASQFLSSLKAYVFPVFGNVPVGAIDKALVLRAIEPIWYRVPETASRVRGRIEQVLDYAVTRDYRAPGQNPANWDEVIKHALPPRQKIAKTKHYRALPFAELPAFMSQLRQRGGIAAKALEFTILTAARTSEVCFARWSEIDFDKRTWTVPADRMKARKEHTVPLSARAIEILKALPSEGEFVFIGSQTGTTLGDSAMSAVLKRMGRRDIVVHGFRSTFSTWCSEQTNYPADVREMALAHSVGSKTERAYKRGDLLLKRARLMAEWAKFCTSEPVDTADNVRPLRSA